MYKFIKEAEENKHRKQKLKLKQKLYDAEVGKIEQAVEEDRQKFVKNKKIEYDRLRKQAVESKQRF